MNKSYCVMRRILEIINLAGSAENFIGCQMSYFQNNGDYEVHLICSSGPHLDAFCKEQGVKYKAIPLNRQISLVQDVKSFFSICNYIRKNKIDIIFCHQAKARTLAIPASFLMGVKHRIIFSHGVLHETMKGLKRRLVLTNDRLLGKLATRVICVSHYVANRRAKDGIDTPDKQVIIGHGSCSGIDVENVFNPNNINREKLTEISNRLGVDSDDYVMGFCGRLVKDKGIVELTEAFELLRHRYPDKKLKLLIIGCPENRDAVPQYIMNRLMNNDNVVFTGSIPHIEMPYYYSLMNVFILPSHRDGLGMVPLEAQAMGVPAIVSSITGCKETIVDGVTGKYCDLSKESIADEIEYFFDLNKANSMGQEGRNFVVKCFNSEVFKQQMLDFINTLT